MYLLCGRYYAFTFLNQFSTIPFMKILRDKFSKQLRDQIIDLDSSLEGKFCSQLRRC